MVEKDPGNEDGPSLEMPKLGFGFLRRRKQDDQPETSDAEAEDTTEDATEAAVEGTAPDADPDTIFDEDEQPAEAAGADEVPELDEEPAEPETRDIPVEEPELADAPPAADTPVIASPAEDLDSAPADEPTDEAEADAEIEPPAPEATSLTKTPEPAEPVEETADPDTEATTVITDVPETEAAGEDQDEEATAPATKPERTVSLPPLSGLTAAAVTGVAVGLLAVLLTFLALRGCEQVRGTSSCGGPGLFLLIAIMVICVLAGRFLLAAWNVTDPGSTSFLAVGLLAVIALLFLVQVLFEWWMIILIPLVALATFMLSHWVTTALIEPADRD